MRKVHVSELALGQRFAFSLNCPASYVCLAANPDATGRKDVAAISFGTLGALPVGGARVGEQSIEHVYVEDVQEFLPAADRTPIVRTLQRAVREGTGGLSRDAAACLALLRETVPEVAPVPPRSDTHEAVDDGLRRALVCALEGSGPLSTSETWVTHSDQGPQRVRVSTWPEWFPVALDALEHAGIKRHELNLRDGM